MDNGRDGPVARPSIDEGATHTITDEQAADLAAEAFVWLRELPELDDGRAEEIATMFYELITDDWADALHGDDTDAATDTSS